MLNHTHPLKLSLLIPVAIVVPLLIEAGFLFVVLNSLTEMEKKLEAEAHVANMLSLVNLVLNDTWMAGGSFLMSRISGDRRFTLEALDYQTSLFQRASDLSDLARTSSPKEAAQVNEFIGIIKDIEKSTETFQQMAEEGFSVNQLRFASKFRSLTKRVNSLGMKLIEEHSEKRKQLQSDQARTREQLRQTITLWAVANVAFAVALGILFGRWFSARWNVLMRNALSLAVGKPLEKPIGSADELGHLDGIIHGLAADLSSAREKERALIDKTAEVICSLDGAAKISEINPAVEKRFGYTADNLLGTNLQYLVYPDDRDTVRDRLQDCKKTEGDVVFECRLKKADDRFAFTEWTVHWSEPDQTYFCVVLDVTAKTEADNLKKDVLAMVSHDLRAPLTSIKLVLDCASQGIYGALNESGNKAMHGAHHSSDYLLNMISDLLDIENFEAGGLTLLYDATTSKELIDMAVATVQPEADKKAINIERDVEDFELSVDTGRLRRTLVNLMGNAIKFSPQKSAITVRCRLLPGDAGAEFSVSDSGPGIPPEKAALVFEKYRQVGTGSEGERKGSGLGLAICKTLVEAHRGNIGVREKSGSGSEFWFQIPLADDIKLWN